MIDLPVVAAGSGRMGENESNSPGLAYVILRDPLGVSGCCRSSNTFSKSSSVGRFIGVDLLEQ